MGESELDLQYLNELWKRAVWDQEGKRFCYPEDLDPAVISELIIDAGKYDEARQRAERAEADAAANLRRAEQAERERDAWQREAENRGYLAAELGKRVRFLEDPGRG